MTEQNTFSISELQQQANAGNAQAQFALGLYYSTIIKDWTCEIAEGWEFKSKLFHEWQMDRIGGETAIEREILSAFYAAENNQETNDETAFMWFEKAAEQGIVEAQYAVARCYFDGKNTKQSDDLAFKWAEKASHQGFSEAFELLGDLFREGRGVDQDDKLALESYEKAVDKDVKGARRKQLHMLLTGKGIKDYDKSREVIKKFNDDVSKALGNRANQLMNVLEKECPLHSEDGEDPFENFLQGFNKDSELLTGWLKNCSLVAIDAAEESEKLKQENEALNKSLHEKEKEMLSFFTHTMRNALATAPESLRQAIHLLGGEVYEKDTKHYQAINKIAALFSTLSLTDCLIDTFKQSISDPQEFRQSWQNDHTGEASPKWVIASALRQALNRIIFMSDTTELRKLLNNLETALIKATRKSFIEEVLPLNVDSHGVEVFYGWTLAHIPAVEVSIADSDTLNFGVNQIRFSLLFAITSELILNALKYWDGENRIQIAWQLTEQGSYVFSVINHCKANASSNLAGTHKGLAFIKRLVELLGDHAQFVCKSEGQLFTAELILTKALFDGAS